MSWESAQRDADKWIQKMSLPKPLKGKVVNLDDFMASIPAEGNYRVLVLRATKRLLEKRGAEVYFTQPSWATGPLDE